MNSSSSAGSSPFDAYLYQELLSSWQHQSDKNGNSAPSPSCDTTNSETSASPSPQGTVTEQSAVLTQQGSVLPPQIDQSSLEVLPTRKRNISSPEASSRKKRKTDSEQGLQQVDDNQTNARERSRLANRKFRERQKDNSHALEEQVEELRSRVEKLYQCYQPSRSIDSELESFMAENPLKIENDTEEEETIAQRVASLSEHEKKIEMRKLKIAISARKSRATKKNHTTPLELQKKFLEDKIKQLFSNLASQLSQENASLKQENARLQQELNSLKDSSLNAMPSSNPNAYNSAL